MLHNSGPYGPNDVPINMGVPVNVTQMPNPMNSVSNIGNLVKIPQQTPQTSAPHYNMPDYSSYGHPPLNMGHSMSPLANYHHLNFQTSYGQPNPDLTHNIVPNNVQNNVLPMNLNVSSDHSPSLMNYHSFEGKRFDVNNTNYRENLNRKMPINIPQIHTKAFHKQLEMESNDGHYNAIQENTFDTQDLSKTPEKTLIDSNRRKSLENTVKLIENILINSTPKDKLKSLNNSESFYDKTILNDTSSKRFVRNDTVQSTFIDNGKELKCNANISERIEGINQSNADLQTSGTQIKNTEINIQDHSIKISSKMDPANQIIVPKTQSIMLDNANISTEHSNITNFNTTAKTKKTKVSNNGTKLEKNSTTIQSEIHCQPLRRSLINRTLPDNKLQTVTNKTDSKEEPITEINIKKEIIDNTVQVKMEPLENETDNLFLRDMNATHGDNVEADAVVVEENSIADAREAVMTGSIPKTYYECPYCNLLFCHPKRFLIHTKWHTFGLTNEKRQELAKEKELKRNMKREAKIIERLNSKEVKDGAEGGSHPCKDCDKVFAAKSSLKNHRQRYHPTRVRQCKVCNASVVGWMALRAHAAAHAAGAGHACPECPKRFKYRHSLAKHRDTHLEKTHGCSQCSKKFGSQALLKMHMKCHERAARGATFRCSYCGKGFFESYNLQVHERTHRNERPFLCEICKTSFGTNSSLKRHLKVSHSTAKPFPCPTCQRCFASTTTRARHVSRVHGDPAAFEHACPMCPRRYKALKELQKHVSKAHHEQRE